MSRDRQMAPGAIPEPTLRGAMPVPLDRGVIPRY